MNPGEQLNGDHTASVLGKEPDHDRATNGGVEEGRRALGTAFPWKVCRSQLQSLAPLLCKKPPKDQDPLSLSHGSQTTSLRGP